MSNNNTKVKTPIIHSAGNIKSSPPILKFELKGSTNASNKNRFLTQFFLTIRMARQIANNPATINSHLFIDHIDTA